MSESKKWALELTLRRSSLNKTIHTKHKIPAGPKQDFLLHVTSIDPLVIKAHQNTKITTLCFCLSLQWFLRVRNIRIEIQIYFLPSREMISKYQYHTLKWWVFVFSGPGPWPLAQICIWRQRPQFVFSGPSLQSVLTGPQPSICIYRVWLIRVGNNKIQRLHIMLLFIFLMFKSFVTTIGWSSFLLLVSSVAVRHQFIIIWWLLTCFKNSH